MNRGEKNVQFQFQQCCFVIFRKKFEIFYASDIFKAPVNNFDKKLESKKKKKKVTHNFNSFDRFLWTRCGSRVEVDRFVIKMKFKI